MEAVIFLFALLVCWLICAGIGGYIAAQKGRSETEGAVLGFLLGPLGLLIEALLPTVQAPKRRTSGRAPRRTGERGEWVPEYSEAWDKPAPPKDETVDDQVLGFLREREAPPDPAHQIDLNAIVRANTRPGGKG
jgi:hypothetical protein